jgi:hypothetical protein
MMINGHHCIVMYLVPLFGSTRLHFNYHTCHHCQLTCGQPPCHVPHVIDVNVRKNTKIFPISPNFEFFQNTQKCPIPLNFKIYFLDPLELCDQAQ